LIPSADREKTIKVGIERS